MRRIVVPLKLTVRLVADASAVDMLLTALGPRVHKRLFPLYQRAVELLLIR